MPDRQKTSDPKPLFPGPPPHVHRREEEGFYILEGEITFTIGEQRLVASAGMFANMPVGTPHSFKNESGTPVVFLAQSGPTSSSNPGPPGVMRSAAGSRGRHRLLARRNEDFWETVLLFFINHPRLDLVHIGPIVDFLQAQRFTTTEGVSADGVFGTRPPHQPDYTMKGRTVASILRQVAEWHRQLGQEVTGSDLSWSRSRIKEFRLVEGSEVLQNMRVWTITELLTSQELFLEGQAMRHCIATYALRCARKQTAIWSVQVENRQGRHRVLTIEVDLAKKTICQARKKFNRLPQAVEREVLHRWATREGLNVIESLRP